MNNEKRIIRQGSQGDEYVAFVNDLPLSVKMTEEERDWLDSASSAAELEELREEVNFLCCERMRELLIANGENPSEYLFPMESMPYDKDGKHATGYQYPIYFGYEERWIWYPEYED